MNIGFVPDPLNWDRWNEAKALLEPARRLGDFKNVLEPNEIVCAVMDGDDLLAVATAWLSVDRYVEVKLVGGRERGRWLAQMDEVIGKAAREAGATRMIAIGRRGWLRELSALGWAKVGETDSKTWVYSREV